MINVLDKYIVGKPDTFKRWGLHAAFWVGYLVLFGFIWAKNAGDLQRSFLFELVALPSRMTAVYLSIYWLLPQFLLKKKYIHFLLGLGAVLLIAGIIFRALNFYIFQADTPNHQTQGFWNTYQIIRGMVLVNATVIVAITIKVLKYWFQNQQQLKLSEQARIQSELNFLKNQVHPHFFFNTLNNLYGLAIEKSDEAPELILRLSQLMRYMLYETQTELVPLSNEINHLHHYIELEKIRYQEGFQLMFQVKGEVITQQIPPLLLLPFVENAFKHGLSEQLEEAWVQVYLEATPDQLIFKVENSVAPSLNLEKAAHSGLGLLNVRQRLEHIFPEKYTLEIIPPSPENTKKGPKENQVKDKQETEQEHPVYAIKLILPLTNMPVTKSNSYTQPSQTYASI